MQMSRAAAGSLRSDVVVVGGGIVGLSIALELERRGATVTVVERGLAVRQTSIAAAGMLAVDDPHNPLPLLPLSRLSASLYPGFLRQIEQHSGTAVPFQTHGAVQHFPDGRITRLAEHSLDPRQLAPALFAAVRAAGVRLVENTSLQSVTEGADGVSLELSDSNPLAADYVVYATGAWTPHVTPRKGQMLRVALPSSLSEVHRNEHVYVVPRTTGPQAGTALIGATVEDAGFDTTVHAADLSALRNLAVELLPWLADEIQTPVVEAWAGLRPATTDGLPLIGAMDRSRRQFVASGHFRNGILLAPGTALVIADLLEQRTEAVDLAPFDLAPFDPQRFSHQAVDIRPSVDDKGFLALR
jgi:glycine oxidase